jgi:hypothetical protein
MGIRADGGAPHGNRLKIKKGITLTALAGLAYFGAACDGGNWSLGGDTRQEQEATIAGGLGEIELKALQRLDKGENDDWLLGATATITGEDHLGRTVSGVIRNPVVDFDSGTVIGHPNRGNAFSDRVVLFNEELGGVTRNNHEGTEGPIIVTDIGVVLPDDRGVLRMEDLNREELLEEGILQSAALEQGDMSRLYFVEVSGGAHTAAQKIPIGQFSDS